MFGRNSNRIKELEALVGHLKDEKRKRCRTLRNSISEISKQQVDYLCGFISEEDYFFVDRQGVILGYTPSLASLLGIPQEIKGQDYLSLLNIQDGDTRRRLRKYFSTDEPLEVRYTIKIKGKEREIVIHKEKPFYLYLDLTSFGGRENARVVSYVPIKVEIPGFFSRRRSKGLPNLSEDITTPNSPPIERIYADLVIGGWTAERIEKLEKRRGEEGLIKEWRKLKKPKFT
jgi:PAS domain-containing protein